MIIESKQNSTKNFKKKLFTRVPSINKAPYRKHPNHQKNMPNFTKSIKIKTKKKNKTKK